MGKEQISAPTGALKPGLILGLFFILALFVGYFADAKLLINQTFSAVVLLGLIVGAVVMALQFRKSNGGYLSYGGSYSFHFIALAIGGALGILFTILLFEVIDPELQSYLGDILLNNIVERLENRGQTSANITSRYESLKEFAYNQLTTVTFLKRYIFLLIVFAIVSSLVALIAKKSKPEAEVS